MMTDREMFEDQETIDRYLAAMPQPDTGCRAALRAQLTAAPATRRLRLPRLRWPWTAGISVVIAAAVALALLLVPFGPHQESPLNPRTVLARAADAATNITPYRATAELSVHAPDDSAPAATAGDLGTSRIVFESMIEDATHWRVNTRILQPALLSNDEVAVANGSTVTWYVSATNRAVRYPLSPWWVGLFLLSELQGGQVLPMGQTLAQYVQELNNPQTGTHARALGQETVLGRAADVVEVWPISRSTSGSCHSAAQCLKQSTGYGRARLWIDHEHGVVLRYQQFDMPAHGLGAGPQNFLYQVTAISFGAGPTPAELAYQPPVRPVEQKFKGGPVTFHSSGSGSSGRGWTVPPGFIAAGPPSDSSGIPYTLTGSGSGGDSTFGGDSANAVFHAGSPQTGPGSLSGFLYVQEQRRVTGLPPALKAGTRWPAGTCVAYTGTYADGLHWLALARGDISVLAVANVLDERALAHWAATQVCP